MNITSKPYPFQNGLIIHVNRYNHQICGGYFVENGKAGKNMTARQISVIIAANWEIPISFCNV